MLDEEKEIEGIGAMACSIFNQLRVEKVYCDALITVDGAEFDVHKIILCGCSPYFKALFTSCFYPLHQHQYNIPGVSAHITELIIKYAYGQHVNITEENVHDLLIAADYLEISGLVNKCCGVLKAQLCSETCIGSWHLAHFYSLEKLKQQAFQMVLRSFEDIVMSKEFLELTVEQLSEVIENDNLSVKHENVVFDTILKWTHHALQERKEQIGMLLPKVRMGLLTSEFLMDRVKNNAFVLDNVVSEQIIKSAEMFMCGFKMMTPYFTRPRLPNAVLLAVGGRNTAIEAYDSRTDCWADVTCSYGTLRIHHGTVTVKMFVYCIGGYDGKNHLKSVSRFGPISRTWMEASPMHSCRCHVAVCVLDDQIYAIGGYDGNTNLNSAEKYNPDTDEWNMIAPMHQQRTEARAAVLNGKVYVCGGSNGDHLSTAEFYSPQIGHWTFVPNMISKRTAAGVSAYKGELYVVGGVNLDGILRSAEVYNPQTNSWRNIPDMLDKRSNFGTGVMADRLFVVGGFYRTGVTNKVECYDYKTAKWYAVKETILLQIGRSCCVLSDLPNMAQYIKQNVPSKGGSDANS